jgi:hypothetical protein
LEKVERRKTIDFAQTAVSAERDIEKGGRSEES